MTIMSVTEAQRSQSPSLLQIRCNRKKNKFKEPSSPEVCNRLVGEVVQVSSQLVLLQSPHEWAGYRWPEIDERSFGWTLAENVQVLSKSGDNKGSARRISAWDQPRNIEYHRKDHRVDGGGERWRADVLGEAPIILASFCCGDVQVISAAALKDAWRRSKRRVRWAEIQHNVDAGMLFEQLISRG